MCSSKRGELIKSWKLKVKRLTTTKLLLLIMMMMMMMMMMAMTKTVGITKITMKKKIKKLNFNYPSARLIYSHVPVSVKQFTRFIE